MPLEAKPWDAAEFLQDQEDLAGYLDVVLEDDGGPILYARTVGTAARARGGIATLAHESGIPQQELETAMRGSEEEALPVIQKLAAAYSKLSAGRLVA